MLSDELLAYLFDGQPHLLAESMETWLGSSRRFTAFVGTFRDKIRKKLRVPQDEETLYDLRLELETAYLLLREPRLSLVYEPLLSGKARGPDFAVSYTTSLTFMVEVTRLRVASSSGDSSPGQAERLMDAVCTKLGQLLPGHSNVIIVGADSLSFSQNDLQATMLRIQRQAERSEPVFWQRYGFRDRADFFRHYQRLSEVILRRSQRIAEGPPLTWLNPQAKYSLPAKVKTALYRSHTA